MAGKPGMLQFMGLQRVRHGLATKQQKQILVHFILEDDLTWANSVSYMDHSLV